MKKTLFLLFLAFSVVLSAGPHRYRPKPRYRPHPVHVSWKHVAAGGAAAGTVIAAYKVSNGVEEGLKTVAEKKPEAFTYPLTMGGWLLRFLLLIIAICVGYRLKLIFSASSRIHQKISMRTSGGRVFYSISNKKLKNP